MDKARTLYSEYLNTHTDADKLLDFVSEGLEAQREESDGVLPAYLAECMTDMNNEKNIEIKGFHSWLDGERAQNNKNKEPVCYLLKNQILFYVIISQAIKKYILCNKNK